MYYYYLLDLVDTIEKSRNLIEENELLSDEELNTLKQTSSLVAKFQREALAEKENRVSAELLAKEKVVKKALEISFII